MKPTKVSKLFLILIVTGWLVGVVAFVLRQQFQIFIQFPLNYFIATMSIALAIGVWTLLAKNRISGPLKTFSPIQSARTAALALAGSHTGAILAGGSTGLLFNYLLAAPSSANSERIQVLSLTVVSSLFLIAVSLWLERICTVPDQKDDK